MIITREWCMPSRWTFDMKPVKKLFKTYAVGKGWFDPFAGRYSAAEYTNDIEPRDYGNGDKHYTGDALVLLQAWPTRSTLGVLFDPPYSVEQCLRRYTPKQGGTAGRAEYWAKCKDQIARIVKPGGLVISFCWDSTGVGKKRGFDIIQILLLCHGACHNDTIVTVEQKVASSAELRHEDRQEALSPACLTV